MSDRIHVQDQLFPLILERKSLEITGTFESLLVFEDLSPNRTIFDMKSFP